MLWFLLSNFIIHVHFIPVQARHLSQAYVFLQPPYNTSIALKNCLCILTISTVNIIPSALKVTPATKSMINKAQYCQRHRQCNIMPSTHSHEGCNLVLVLKISLQLGGRDRRNEHRAKVSHIFICSLYCTS